MTSSMGSSAGLGSVQAVVEIAATPDAVFAALTDQHELAAWLGGDTALPGNRSGAALPSFAVPGQPWHVPAIAPDGSLGSVSGEFVLVDPPRRLESTWRASWDDFAPDRVCFELTPIRIAGMPGTRVRVTHICASAHLRVTAMVTPGAAIVGEWPAILARLAARLATPVGAARHPSFGDWT
jgi:uncharacterized protein YndB with AHSA1/START domain